MLRTKAVSLALLYVLLIVVPATATEYFDLGMHGRVQVSDIVVLARVVDPALALVNVERVLKGEAPKQLTLVAYVDGFAVPAQRKPSCRCPRLLFQRRACVRAGGISRAHGRERRPAHRSFSPTYSLSQTVASINASSRFRLEPRGDAETTQPMSLAEKFRCELQMWALWKARSNQVPSPVNRCLSGVLAYGQGVGPVLGAWNATGLVANAVVTWRLQRAAPFFAKILTTSGSGDERAWAAMALGGSGDRAYLPVLRRVATEDAHGQARALAYNGIMYMLGPDSLGDLRLGAKDSDDKVRARAVVDSYNLLEFGHPEPRWPPPSNALIAEVRTFLTEMQRDPARLVSDNAKSMLAMIAQQRP